MFITFLFAFVLAGGSLLSRGVGDPVYTNGEDSLAEDTPPQLDAQPAGAGTYNQSQQIYSLSLLTNAGFGLTFPTTEDRDAFVFHVVTDTLSNRTIQEYMGGDWEIVWGPVSYSNSTCGSSIVIDNTMILFYSPSQNLFVLAIAGTNINSVYGFLKEDFAVSTLVNWQNVVGTGVSISIPPTAAISTGSYTGLQILLNMEYENYTMLQALSAILEIQPNSTLAVVGHSLGGALASCMGLYMQNIQYDPKLNWNTNNAITQIMVLPTAGPTPGEEVFATFYGSILHQYQSSFTYNSVYNPLDIVPQAWQLSTMETIPQIYNISLWTLPSYPSDTIGSLVLTGMLLTGETNYTQVLPWTPLGFPFWNYTFCQNIEQNLTLASYVLGFGAYYEYLAGELCFFYQLGYQHTTAYYTLLQISDFANDYQWIKSRDAPTEEELHMQALGRAFNLSD